MEIKVGKNYVLPGETRKRESSEVVWTTAWLVLMISWSIFMLTVSITSGFWNMPVGDMLALTFLCSVPMLVFAGGFFYMLKGSRHVKTLEFLVHEYERWNWKDSRYDKFYLKEAVCLIENYTYHKHTGDTIKKMTPEELENHCNNMDGDYSYGYNTKEEVMLSILNDIKRLIADDKANENIKIRNIKTLDVLSVEELKTKLENKEFDHLLKDSKG